MNVQGQITSIVPDGGYQGTNGYISTFQMTIQAPDGLHTGQIGSKSQTYPIAIGEQIAVTVTNTQHGVRFKKFNPQYQQGQQSQSSESGGQKEQRIMRGNSLNAMMSAAEIPLDMVGEYLYAGVQFILTGKWDLKPTTHVQTEPDPQEDDMPF